MALMFTTAETGYHVRTMDDLVRKHWSAPEAPEILILIALAKKAGIEDQVRHVLTPPEPKGPHPVEVSTEAIAHAIVRQSRWVVVCPWCPGAEYAHTSDKRFFCIDCGNVAVDGKWIGVEWPDNPEEIEAHLMLRPVPDTRNWEWGEKSTDLIVENFDHGVSSLVKP